MFVCFITKSFLTYSFVLPTHTLSTVCSPLSSYVCSITPETANVGSSYSHMRGPGVGCWFSNRSNCSHWSFEAAVLPIKPNIYTDQWEPIVIHHSITFTGRYTTTQPTLLTSWLQLLSYKVQTITHKHTITLAMYFYIHWIYCRLIATTCFLDIALSRHVISCNIARAVEGGSILSETISAKFHLIKNPKLTD